MNATLNGTPPRKQLSHQLDRLDAILDGLADGLNDAVAAAVAQAAQDAVKAAIAAVLTNPDLLRALQGQATAPPATSASSASPQPPSSPPMPQPPSIVSRVSRSLWTTACSAARKVGSLLTSVARTAWAITKAPITLVIRCARPVAAALANAAQLASLCLAWRPI